MRTLSYRVAALALILSVALPGLAATAPKKEAAFGKGGGPMLTREQLRVCLGHKGVVAQQDADVAKEKEALAQAKADIARSGTALAAQLESLDRTQPDAVVRYNDAAQARDQQIDAYDARVTAFNDQARATNAERASFSADCENRRYLEDDEIAIKKGK